MSAVIINVDTSLTNIPTINIGKQGENGATQVVFDVSEMIETYGSGTAYVVVQRRGDAEPYLLDNTSQSGDKVTWTVSNVDTDVYGTGRVQLFWLINEQVAKTVTYQFYVEEALHDPQDAPVVPGGWISEKIGDLDELTTTDKDNLVDAINEVNAQVTENTEDLSDVKKDLKLKADLPTETIENESIASFTDGAEDAPVKELKVGIEPIQSGSGDPSPTNVRPISGHDSVTVTRTGVNVWDEEWESGQFDWNTGQEMSSTAFIRFKNRTPVEPSSQYAFVKPIGIHARPVYYDINGEFISGPDVIYTSQTYTVITIPDNVHYVRFAVQVTTYGNNISLNYPSTDHDYHAYEGTSYPIPLSSTIYGGTLDVETGNLAVTHGVLNLSDATFGTSSNRAYIDNFNTLYGAKLPTSAYEFGEYIAEQYKEVKASASITVGTMAILQTGSLYFYYDGTNLPTGKIVFPLATPTAVQLTPAQVTTLLKDNNIFADSGDVKKLIYRADLGAYIEKLINA